MKWHVPPVMKTNIFSNYNVAIIPKNILIVTILITIGNNEHTNQIKIPESQSLKPVLTCLATLLNCKAIELIYFQLKKCQRCTDVY